MQCGRFVVVTGLYSLNGFRFCPGISFILPGVGARGVKLGPFVKDYPEWQGETEGEK